VYRKLANADTDRLAHSQMETKKPISGDNNNNNSYHGRHLIVSTHDAVVSHTIARTAAGGKIPAVNHSDDTNERNRPPIASPTL